VAASYGENANTVILAQKKAIDGRSKFWCKNGNLSSIIDMLWRKGCPSTLLICLCFLIRLRKSHGLDHGEGRDDSTQSSGTGTVINANFAGEASSHHQGPIGERPCAFGGSGPSAAAGPKPALAPQVRRRRLIGGELISTILFKTPYCFWWEFRMTDRQLALDAVSEAQRILEEYLEPRPHDTERLLDRLVEGTCAARPHCRRRSSTAWQRLVKPREIRRRGEQAGA